MAEEKVTAIRLLFTGLLALAWKKKLFMVLSYKDEANMIQNIVFDGNKIEEVQSAIYRSVLSAKGRLTCSST